MARKRIVKIARVYDPPLPGGGVRVLVDRIWPRGMRKEGAPFDEWVKAVAPSTALRQWFAHRPDRFDEFSARYRAELDDPERQAALQRLAALADADKSRTLTLLTASKEAEISHVEVLRRVLAQR